MKRLWPFSVLVLLCAACGGVPTEPTSQTQPSPTSTSTPKATPTPTPIPTPTPWPTPEPKKLHQDVKVYALLHQWYMAGYDHCPPPSNVGPAHYWAPWMWGHRLDDPCNTYWSVGAPWLREISSPAYPLTGVYDSRNDDIKRWQIRQAKSARIDGFVTGVYYSTPPSLTYLYDQFFGNEDKGIKGLLRIAQEEQFTVGIEMWSPNPGNYNECETWKSDIGHIIDAIQSSPYRSAYITIDGMPMIRMPHISWMKDSDRRALLDGTDEHHRISWVFRDAPVDEIVALNKGLQYSHAQFDGLYNFPQDSGWWMNPLFTDDFKRINDLHDPHAFPIAHGYIGYDEQAGVPNPEEPYGMRHAPRNGTSTMTNFMSDAIAAGATIIYLESFNEWGEGSMLEAGINIQQYRPFNQEYDLYLDAQRNSDPFKYLRALAQFFGSWTPPEPPPCSAVDPLMPQYYTNYRGVYCLE